MDVDLVEMGHSAFGGSKMAADGTVSITSALESERGQAPEQSISRNLLREYGNNYFELITYDYGLNNNKWRW